MQKKDFIQQAVLEWMPLLDWEFDKALGYAKKAWHRLDEAGFGDVNRQGPREIPKAYDQLKKHPVMLAAFDLFWVAFDYKQGKDRAAARWLQQGQLSKTEYDQIVKSAKLTAQARKNLPEGQAPKMAEGWLTDRRWLDSDETPVEATQKQHRQHEHQLRQINQDLAHAKRMAAYTGEDFWQAEADKLTEQLRNLRAEHD